MAKKAKSKTQLPIGQAERLVDETLERFKLFALKGLALAREEAEDIWAEAQALRTGTKR